MIGALRGTVHERLDKAVLLDVGGVIYEVFVTPATRQALDDGQTVTLYTTLYQREEGPALYGFLNFRERTFFRLLLTVSGVGPKSALGIMGLSSVEELERSIASGDIQLLTRVSGIGKKTAERLVVELKEKIAAGESAPVGEHAETVHDALTRLGYTSREAREIVKRLDRQAPVEEQVRQALRVLGKR